MACRKQRKEQRQRVFQAKGTKVRVCLGNCKQQMKAQNAGKEVQDEVGETGLRRLWSFKLITKVLGEPFRVFKWVSDVISFASERCI